MAKEQEAQSNQLNLTVVALVALVAIVGLVALVMNAASVGRIATGSQAVSAVEPVTVERSNIAGQAFSEGYCSSEYKSGGDWCKTCVKGNTLQTTCTDATTGDQYNK